MKELININYDSERPTVTGRDLHDALQVKTHTGTGFRGCASMAFWRVWTFAHF